MRSPVLAGLLAVSLVPAAAFAKTTGGSSSSSSSGGSSAHTSSSSSSSSSSGGSHTSGSSSSSSSSSGSRGSGSHTGGPSGTHAIGRPVLVRDHRTGGHSGNSSSGNGSRPVTVRDHRTHVVNGVTVVEDGSDFYADPDYDPYAFAYDCCSADDAVGYTDEPYGRWGKNMPHFALELGTGVRHFSDPLAKENLMVAGSAQNYQFNGTGNGNDSAVTTQLRLLVHLSRAVYIGGEGELGGIVGTPSAVATGSQQAMVYGPSSEVLLGAAGVVGAMERQGNARFGVEVAGGVRAIEYKFRGLGQDIDQTTTTGVIEPRARAEYWVSPFLALGAMAGANVLEKSDWMAGAYFAVHTHAFGD